VKSVWLEPNQLARIPGYWIDKEGHDTPVGTKPAQDEKIVLFLHGGGFISESAHPHNKMAQIPRSILSQCASAKRALAVEYRLCDLSPVYTNPFPTALLDAISGYHYLIETVGVSPSNVILVGDSAGGNLALALARYIVENTAELSRNMGNMSSTPPDYAMILLSPWCDLGTSHETPGSATIDYSYDFLADLRTGIFAAARRAYCDSLGFSAANTNRYLSPASLDAVALFDDFPRTFIELGDAERFVDMCRTLRDKMVVDMGKERVTYYEAKDAIHDHLLFPFEEPQNTKSLEAIATWLAEGKQ